MYIMYYQLYLYVLLLVCTGEVGVHHVPMTLYICTTPCLYRRTGCTLCTTDSIYIYYVLLLVCTGGMGLHHVPMTLSIYTTPCLYRRGGCTLYIMYYQLYIYVLLFVCAGGVGVHHVPRHRLYRPVLLVLLLHHLHLLPGLDGEECLHRRHHGDVQRNQVKLEA